MSAVPHPTSARMRRVHIQGDRNPPQSPLPAPPSRLRAFALGLASGALATAVMIVVMAAQS